MSNTLANHSRFRGMFKIERQQHRPDGSPIPGTKEVVAPWQDNLLLNSGLDNLASSGWMNLCYLGAGSSPPSVTDTSLDSVLGSTTTIVTSGPSSSDYSSVVGEWVFPPGTATGIVSEIGVGPNSGLLTTRSLIKDESGNPTTITKGPIDSLTVTYQIREYPDQGDSSYVVTNPHTSQEYSVVSRTIGGMSGSGGGRLYMWYARGPISPLGSGYPFALDNNPLVAWNSTSYPSSAGNMSTTAGSISGYVSGNYYIDVTLVWNESRGNAPEGHVSRVTTATSGQGFRLQASFDPPIDKDNTKTLRITLRKSWGRYVP